MSNTGKSEHKKDIEQRKDKADKNFKGQAKDFQKNAGIKEAPAKLLPAEDMSRVFTDFLDNAGLVPQFNDFIAAQGYKPTEFGMEEE